MEQKPKRNLKWFLGCRFFSSLSDQIIMFAIPIIVYQLTQDIRISGAAFAIEWLPRIAALPTSGYLVDRIGSRKLYLWADVGRAILAGLMLASGFYDWAFLPYLLAILAGMVGFFHEMAFIALEAGVPKMIAKKDIPKTQSILQGIDLSGQLAGPGLGMLLAGYLPITWLFGIVSIVFVVSAINAMVTLPIESAHRSATMGSVRELVKNTKDSFQLIFRNISLIRISIIAMLINILFGISLAASAGYIQEAFARNETDFGWLNTASGVIGVLVSFLLPVMMRWISVHEVGFVGILLGGVSAVALGVAGSFNQYIGAFALLVIADSAVNVYIRSERVNYLPPDKLGSGVSALVLLNFSVFPLAGLLVTLGANQIPVLLQVSGVLVASIGFLVFLHQYFEAKPRYKWNDNV
jgi:MFS family permease